MLSAFKKLFDRFNSNEIFRYLVAGGLTTLVNLVVFTVLRYGVKLSLTLSNFIAIVLAILFAFFINKYYAFKTPAKKKSEVLTEFVKFIGGRLFSMIIEIVGVYILAVWAGLPDMVAKIITQFIVVIVNYVISKLFVFKKDGVKRTFFEWMKDNLLYELAFILPAILFIAICIMTHVAPFGTTTLMLVDSLHQYLPFYSDYYDKLKESGEFLYSWNGGMGYNYVTLWSYYLSSPFLLLILFFPKTMINTAMTLVIGLKICSCSLSLCYAIDKIYDTKKDLKILCFGLAYAFSNYVIGYYWNNMWLDVLIMAPLVLLGVKKLIDDANPKFYIITLFLALFGNFYIGFMLCIFLVFWFLIYPHKSVKDFFKSGVRFAISSLISAGMAAFMLLPTFQGLMNTSPAKSEMPKFTWYGEWETLYKKFAIYVGAFNNDNNDGELNIYCSLIALFMGMLFLAFKNVSR